MGSAAGAVWGEQSQLDPWGWVGAGCWQQGDLIPALGDAWPGRRSSPLGPGAQEGWAAGSMVQRREITCGMLCIKDTAGFKLGQLAGSRIPEILCL